MTYMDRRLATHANWGLMGLLALLFFIGVANLYSASGIRLEEGVAVSSYYQRQLLWGAVGLGGMVFCMLFDYRHLKSLATPAYVVSIGLLILVLLMGKSAKGAARWLHFAGFTMQPSELVKISVLLMTAKFLSSRKGPLGWRDFAIVTALGAFPAFLIFKQPDLGTSIIVMALMAGMILYHGVKPYVFKTCSLLLPASLPVAWHFLKPYQKQRLLTFFDPTVDPLSTSYHINQSHIAIGSGQIWGKGFLEGTQNQLRFLPEKHTDFAIAVFGEEWGFVGCMLLLTLFCLFLLSLLTTAKDAKDRFGSVLVAGVFFYFFWQILINMGMTMGLMPVVGIPLPFLSYGGSATLMNFCLLGVVLNVSMRRFVFKTS